MKISKIIVGLVVLCAAVACNPNTNSGNGGQTDTSWSDTGSPIGEWVLTEWNGSAELPMGVYLRLNEDNTFDLYQHTLSVMWAHYSGTFSLNGTTLTGTYSDGTDWAEYSIKYNEKANPKQIKLTRKSDSSDVAVYTATEIPDEVTDQANEVTRSCSVDIEKFL